MKGNDTQSDKEIKLSLDCTSAATFGIWYFFLGLVYCLRDPNVNFALKLGLTTLFIHLKFILLLYFQ